MKKTLTILLLSLFGGFLGYLFGKYGLDSLPKDLPKSYLLALFCSLIPIYFFVVGWHELGHAIAGILMKFDFRMYIIGPFFWEKQDGKWKFKWNKSLNLSGGMVVCLPTSEENLKKRFITYAAAGPASSLLLTLLLILPSVILPGSSSNMPLSFLKHLSVISAFLSFLIFLITAIPFKAGSFYTDGGRVKRLLKNDETSEMEVLFLKIMASSNAGLRYRDLNQEDLLKAFQLAEQLNDPFKVYLLSYLHQASFDNGDFDPAEKYLMSYIENINEIPDAFRGMVWLDAAFFFAYARKDIEKANFYWGNFKPSSFIPKAQILATESVLAFVNNQLPEAKTKREAALIELPNMMDKGMAICIKERLEFIEN